MAGCAFLGGAAVLLVLGGRAAEPPGPKVFQKRLRVASVDPATSTIAVREPDLEVSFDAETRFLVHRSIRLKDLKRGKPLHILAKLHTVRTTVTAQSDSAMTEVAFLGAGEAYEHPPLLPQSQFVRWHAGLLTFVGQAPYLRIGEVMHRLAVGEDATVYSLEKITPEQLRGKTVIVRGEAAPAGGDTKGRKVTRVRAVEVHFLELNAEHAKVFQLQWGEARKAPLGLKGEYYDSPNFTNLKVTRVDPSINFTWGTGSPDPSIDPDNFSVRWTGRITPPATGTYTFQVNTDDGVRLWVDNQLIIDKWGAPADAAASVDLTAGKKYDLRMEYVEWTRDAFAKLSWSGPNLPLGIISHTCLEPPPPENSRQSTAQNRQ